MDGWVKLHRELLKKPIWHLSTPEQKTILITLLLMANHDENKWEWNGEQFCCKAGQFVTSLENITKECGKGISIQNVRTALKRFEKYEFLTNESTKTGRLITIVNWGGYQVSENEPNKEDNKDLTKSQQRPNKDLTPNKNDKNDKNINNKEYQKKYSDDSFEMKCVNYLLKSIKDEMPDAKVPTTDKAIDKWCDNIEMMVRLDKRSQENITKVLTYARANDFWKPNIRSTAKLREHYETLYGQMQNSKPKNQPNVAQASPNNRFNQFQQRNYTQDHMQNLELHLIERNKKIN